jgi:hypothetical protein
VKRKRKASAAFLGVPAILTQVVGGCCIRTTFFAGFSDGSVQTEPKISSNIHLFHRQTAPSESIGQRHSQFPPRERRRKKSPQEKGRSGERYGLETGPS